MNDYVKYLTESASSHGKGFALLREVERIRSAGKMKEIDAIYEKAYQRVMNV